MKDFGCFLGSFWNAEMVKAIQNKEENTHTVSDEEFDNASQFVEDFHKNKPKKVGRRHTKRIELK